MSYKKCLGPVKYVRSWPQSPVTTVGTHIFLKISTFSVNWCPVFSGRRVDPHKLPHDVVIIFSFYFDLYLKLSLIECMHDLTRSSSWMLMRKTMLFCTEHVLAVVIHTPTNSFTGVTSVMSHPPIQCTAVTYIQ
jgi:hypothetical protein